MDKKEINKKKVIRQTRSVIYETVSQNLCLAKLTLATINIEERKTAVSKINASKKIISKTIADLRKIANKLEQV